MKKLLLTLPILFVFSVISTTILAEVNIDFLKQKYPKCEDMTYRHHCFDEHNYANSKNIGYFKNNRLWDGFNYSNGVLNSQYVNGKRFAKSFCKKSYDNWFNCPSGTRYKAMENGYHDQNGKQGNFIIEFQSGNKFIGKYKDGQANGQGNLTYANGDKYVGEFKNNQLHGQGKYTFENGTVKEGKWKDGRFIYKNKKSDLTSSSKLEKYKNFCSEIGFISGTEKFGECVLEAMKKG